MTTLAGWVVLAVGIVIGVAVGFRLARAVDRVDLIHAYRQGVRVGRAAGVRWAERQAASRLDARLAAAARLRAHAVVAESEFFDIDAAMSDAGEQSRWHGV